MGGGGGGGGLQEMGVALYTFLYHNWLMCVVHTYD